MIVLTNLTAQTLAPGASLVFDQVRVKSGCNECWRNPSTSVKLRNKGIYDIDFNANIGGATAATPVQLSVQLGGETLPETTMISVPAAAGVLNSVSTATAVRNCCCDFDRVTITNTGAVPVDVGANSALRIGRHGCN